MPITLDRESRLEGAVLVRVISRPQLSLTDELPVRRVGPPATITIDGFDLPTDQQGELEALGYRLAGRCRHPRRDLRATIDVLVTGAHRTTDPAWWTALRGRAERIYDLGMGPVRLVLADELDVHLAAVDS
ncbi:MAG: hypothetical protein WD377_06465 [Nitriliruptoraceae bacterium]